MIGHPPGRLRHALLTAAQFLGLLLLLALATADYDYIHRPAEIAVQARNS